MSLGCNYNIKKQYNSPSFRGDNIVSPSAPLAKPIETVQKSIEGTVDILTPIKITEKEKKSNKKAIAVGSSVLVITGLVALLNPKYSSKLVNNLKNFSKAAEKNIEKNSKYLAELEKNNKTLILLFYYFSIFFLVHIFYLKFDLM